MDSFRIPLSSNHVAGGLPFLMVKKIRVSKKFVNWVLTKRYGYRINIITGGETSKTQTKGNNMFRVERTNKKTVVKEFSSLAELHEFAEKAHYQKGSVVLFKDGDPVQLAEHGPFYGHHLNWWTTREFLKTKGH